MSFNSIFGFECDVYYLCVCYLCVEKRHCLRVCNAPGAVIVVLRACVHGWCEAYPLYAAQVVQAVGPMAQDILLHGEAALQGLGWDAPADP